MIISWTVIARYFSGMEDRIRDSEYLQLSPNPGFLKPIGIAGRRAYRPWLITPTINVWQEVERNLNKDTQFEARGRSSVLKLRDAKAGGERTYGFTLRLYRPGTLCVEVKLLDELDVEISDVFKYRDLSTHPAARTVVDVLIGIVQSGDPTAYSLGNSFSARPSIFFPVNVTADNFISWKEASKAAVVGVLINNSMFSAADDNLATEVFSRNRLIDIKFNKTAFSLVSKQGVVTATSLHDKDVAENILREHSKRIRFLEYALVLQELTINYVDLRTQDEQAADFLLFLALPYLNQNANLPRSVTGTNTWKLLSDEMQLSKMLASIPDSLLRSVEEKTPEFLRIPQDEYDSLNYRQALKSSMRVFSASWFKRDFSGRKIVPWLIGTAIALASAGAAILKIWQH